MKRRSEVIDDVLARELLADERRLNDLERRVARLAARQGLVVASGDTKVATGGDAPKLQATPTPAEIERVERLSSDVSKLVEILGRRMASHEYEWGLTQQRIDQRLQEAGNDNGNNAPSSFSSTSLPFPLNYVECGFSWLLSRIDRMGKAQRLFVFAIALAFVLSYRKTSHRNATRFLRA